MRRGNVTFFDYDLILIPIHQGNHWTLTVKENFLSKKTFFFSFAVRQSIFVLVASAITIHWVARMSYV